MYGERNMNYKLDNPVALKVIECLMVDKPIPVKKVVECTKYCDNDLFQALLFCIRHKIIEYESAVYIYEMYRTTFNDIIKNRNKKLRIRNVMR